MNSLIRVLSHLVVVFSLASITLLILDRFNPLMGFTVSAYSRAVFLALGAAAVLLAVLLLVRRIGKKTRAEQKPREENE